MGMGGMGGMGGTGGTGGTGTSMGSGLALSGLPSGPGGPLLPASAAPGPSAGDGSMPPPGTFAPFTTVPLGRTHVVIERFLAEGGFAHVYLVQVADTQQRAVLKRIVCPEESDLDEQRIEADVHRRVSGHKNIVRFIDSSITPLRTGGYEILILMEYCEGGHLVDFLNTRLESRLSEDEILRVFSDVCEAVVHMHEMQPAHIHRDIKIENVLIAGNGTCKLCDFGSCTTRVVPANAQLTSQDIRRLEDEISKFTTLQYRAPEMCDLYQKRGLCEKVDTWAMGILLFKLCYFTTPFEDGGKLAILNARYNLPSFPVYSQRLKSLINSLLEVDVPKRFNIFQAYAVVCELRGVTYNLKTPPLPSKNERALNDQDPSRPVGQFASGKDGSASFGNLVGSIQTIGALRQQPSSYLVGTIQQPGPVPIPPQQLGLPRAGYGPAAIPSSVIKSNPTQPVLHRQPSIKTMAPASATAAPSAAASAKTASGNPPTVVGDD
nr:hypothetical protein HK105_007080 [Polyrhizophydium stewartii]